MKDAEEILEITNPFVEYGKRRGREEGIQIGVDRGREEEQIRVVKGMLDEGLSVKLIAKVTQLSKEEIEQISQKYNSR